MVDDDAISLRLYGMLLRKTPWEVTTFPTADEAISFLQQNDIAEYSCIVTDYHMPGTNGLDFLNWIHEQDKGLSTVLLTGEADKSLISEGIRNGISDFLEKPVKSDVLVNSIERSIEITDQNRNREGKITSVSKITEIYERLNNFAQTSKKSNLFPSVNTYFFPLQESGGDFVNVFTVSDSKLIILAGDISGHDLTAGFISTYCQGMIRGMIEQKASIQTIAKVFNEFLVKTWNNQAEITNRVSLASCLICMDLEQGRIETVRNGIPAPIYSIPDGSLAMMGKDNPPLGWFDDLEFRGTTQQLGGNKIIRLWSDGLEDFAEKENYNVCSLAHYIINLDSAESADLFLEERTDDIFVTEISYENASEKIAYQPFFYEVYRGDTVNQIDQMQEVWKRSLQLVFPYLDQEHTYNILLCLREGMINALIHGCRGIRERSCTLSMSMQNDSELIHIEIADEGNGFDEISANHDNEEHLSLGQKIIESYTEEYRYENNGSRLIMIMKTIGVDEILQSAKQATR